MRYAIHMATRCNSAEADDPVIGAHCETLGQLDYFLLVELAAVEGIKGANSLVILHTVKKGGLVRVAALAED
ncbi:hypothetical protein DPM33_30665 [Mesorhizobium hawassense]|uniref:Lrp/AsnC family transcriptional regulator n=1 Tax=Mesorhizobium hawassense TaxID=1209954 RepID=A0A330HE09_9HYPH|nr:hypothetical protein DPM33_30665 [Mesorhizobium hawassense]